MTRLGQLLKMMRIERGEVLYDMAKRLGVSSAFLSAVENGKRSAPSSWLGTLADEYDLSSKRYLELQEAMDETVKQVRLDLEKADSRKRSCALAFARNFDDISRDDIEALMRILNKGGKNE